MAVEMNDEYLDQTEVRYLGDVQRLRLDPGDVVVFSSDLRMSRDQMVATHKYLSERLPNQTVLVLDSCLRIGVLGKQGKADGTH